MRFYIEIAAFFVVIFTGAVAYGQLKNQVSNNKENIAEVKTDNKVEHKDIILAIKELTDEINKEKSENSVVRAQNKLLIEFLEKKYGL